MGTIDLCHLQPDVNPAKHVGRYDTEEVPTIGTKRLGALLSDPVYDFIAAVAISEGHMPNARVSFGKKGQLRVLNVEASDGSVTRFASRGQKWKKLK